ncbi:hypothetical protein CLTEP_12840 [Clostridium tepidiprofundi DSM 19306]|uniref:Uncharacterized protein n=1 Tax=Clostridium tepidiprofundi DSM 19306 TaxID=1121338 RepID=A0A151B4I4_9CLOT|nr:hypothetical protein [Clostridium tepidiprofundi]KYH34819.1 hypothetical protein CLTEP_12840 [Clostridium tepidiprofundi DSM 19306]
MINTYGYNPIESIKTNVIVIKSDMHNDTKSVVFTSLYKEITMELQISNVKIDTNYRLR